MMRRENQNQHQAQRDQLSRVYDELSSLVLSLLRSYPSSSPLLPDQSQEIPTPTPSSGRRRLHQTLPQITPAGFASMLLGISVALMLCGSMTFFLGFLLMPWVLGLIMILYIAGIVSAVSMLGRSIFCYALSPPPSPLKDFPAWKMM